MTNIHITKDGDTMFISRMTDEHLLNTIGFYLNKIKSCNNLLANNGIVSSVDMVLADMDADRIREKAKDVMRSSYDRLGRYVTEAVIRDLDISNDMQQAFGRSAGLTSVALDSSIKQLMSENYEY